VPLPKIQSIAVLPLKNLSGDPEQEYFADGMTTPHEFPGVETPRWGASYAGDVPQERLYLSRMNLPA